MRVDHDGVPAGRKGGSGLYGGYSVYGVHEFVVPENEDHFVQEKRKEKKGKKAQGIMRKYISFILTTTSRGRGV